MKVAVHDYSGHPFQVQLSRELARRGHEVVHLHCLDYVSGKGALRRRPSDPSSFSLTGVTVGTPTERRSLRRRVFQERRYAKRLIDELTIFGPDLVISSNNPLFSQQMLVGWCRRQNVRFVFWQQDVYAVAMRRESARRLPLLGYWLGECFVTLERRLLRLSDAVVVITHDFVPILKSWRVPEGRIGVVENWAPIDELPARPRDNAWARRQGIATERVLLYAGTLGHKHDPSLLVALASAIQGEPDVRLVVISEGEGVEAFRSAIAERDVKNVSVLPFQPYADLPDILASGDVLIVILEEDAGVFSVPSKLLSYQCAARPILAAIPNTNLAARTIRKVDAGVVVDPSDSERFAVAALELLSDEELRERLGRNARTAAERRFDISRIGDRFEQVMARAVEQRQREQIWEATIDGELTERSAS